MYSFASKFKLFFFNNHLMIISILLGLSSPILYFDNIFVQILATLIIYIIFLITIEFYNIKQKDIKNTAKWTVLGIIIPVSSKLTKFLSEQKKGFFGPVQK